MTKADDIAETIRKAARAGGMSPRDIDPDMFASRLRQVQDKATRRTTEGGAVSEVAARALGAADRKALKATLNAVARGAPFASAEHAYLAEAIINPVMRPVEFVNGGDYGLVDNPFWSELNTNGAWRANLRRAFASVGRVELPYRGMPDRIYGGTGFVVGKDLLMTNRHVAELFAYGLGDREISFRPGRNSGFDLLREQIAGAGRVLNVRRVRMIHPFWDCALLEVEGLPAEARPLAISGDPGIQTANRRIAVIGYPAFDIRNPEDVQDDLLDETYQVKRLQPGALGAVMPIASFGKTVQAMTHDCSTLGGNSGSALVDLETGAVVGLHFGGAYRKQNYAAPGAGLAADPRLHDAGVIFDVPRPAQAPTHLDEAWRRADAGEAPQLVAKAAPAAAPPSPGAAVRDGSLSIAPDGTVSISVPLHVTIRLGGAGAGASFATGEAAVAKSSRPGKQKLAFDENYASRKGYAPEFLASEAAPEDRAALVVPMPAVTDMTQAAKDARGSAELKYEHFSLVMHAARRLAILTASNVTAERRLKNPGGRKHDRGSDEWRVDPRIPDTQQLPEYFYEHDGHGAITSLFDKGHVVRRDDVSWGETEAELLRADADSYHVTNCSPQVADYNRSSLGEDNWGDLENVVLAQAKSQRLCVMSGAVLATDDQVYVGRLPGKQLVRLKLPRRFWKVVIACDLKGLAAYGFVLEQDLDDVPLTQEGLEAFAPGAFRRFMEPLHEIGRIAGVTFDASLLAADRYGAPGGAEVAHLVEARRRSPVHG